ncbi:MAG: transcriptional repressor [Zetaproteobacteria bacterium]|nr:transcriptional repressor [Zetaproteobacteria bacterium]
MNKKVQSNSDETPYKWFWRALDDYLVKNSLKQTKQRKVIVQEFLAMNPHVDAEQLFERLRKMGYYFGLATVYRTLNLLKDANLVDQLAFSDGRSVFEVNTPDSHHDHLICTHCRKVVEFENEEIEKLQLKVAQHYGFSLESHRLDLFGRCPDCMPV